MRTSIEIAFRRKVRAVWLDQGLALASQDVPWMEAKAVLAPQVAADNPGADTIRKVLEHVRRIWFDPPDDSLELRAAGLVFFRSTASPINRLLLNWGMTIAAYPFVGNVAEALGRLLRLQQKANRSDVQRRLREQYGDREFVNRSTRFNVSSFLDWGIIAEGKPRGTYVPGISIPAMCPDQLGWLAEAVLISRGQGQLPFSQLCRHPVLFPITLDTFNSSVLRTNPRLRVERLSLNEEQVSLLSPPRLVRSKSSQRIKTG